MIEAGRLRVMVGYLTEGGEGGKGTGRAKTHEECFLTAKIPQKD